MAERAALITGGSSGIGYAIAKLLGGELGYALTVNGRRPDKLEAAVEELKSAGVSEIRAAPGNIADEEDIKRVVSEHKDAYGRMDVLINNAGVGIGAPIAEAETKKLDMQPGDIAEAVRFLLSTTPACMVPELMFIRPGDHL